MNSLTKQSRYRALPVELNKISNSFHDEVEISRAAHPESNCKYIFALVNSTHSSAAK